MKDIYTKTLHDNINFVKNLKNKNTQLNEYNFIDNQSDIDNVWKIVSDKTHNSIHWHYHTAESFVEKMEEST
jgi:hypothetical protein